MLKSKYIINCNNHAGSKGQCVGIKLSHAIACDFTDCEMINVT